MTIGGGDALELGRRALVGDTATAALVADDGTIDWWCPERFDAPATFFRLLDRRGGAVRVAPAGSATPVSQSVDPGTLTVRTVLDGRDSRVEVCDLAPWDGQRPAGQLVRLVTVRRGPVDLDVDVVPGRAFGPAREVATWSEGVVFDQTRVRTGIPMTVGPDGEVHGRVRLDTGDRLVVTASGTSSAEAVSPDQARALGDRTATAWRRVLAPAVVDGRWASACTQSLVVLRALSFGSSGGLVAAPTTSLPEVEGGERTTDGRVVPTATVAGWALAATAAGLAEEADAAVGWLVAALDQDVPVPAVLGLDGAPPSSEREVPSLAGWRRSQPVRTGSDGADRPSIEAVAAVLGAAAALTGTPAGEILVDRWDRLVRQADWLAEHRADPDPGPWDSRVRRRWVGGVLAAQEALSAMAELGWRRNPLDLDAAGWYAARKAAEADLVAAAARGRGALGEGAEAAALRVAWWGPWPAADPVVISTVERVRRLLGAGDWLHPYPPDLDDGRPDTGSRPASVVATLWLVRALAALGRWDDANLTMEAVATLAGPAGLLPEYVDPTTGAARGNRPCSAAHLAFLDAAAALSAGPR